MPPQVVKQMQALALREGRYLRQGSAQRCSHFLSGTDTLAFRFTVVLVQLDCQLLHFPPLL